ncbi:MAG: Xaa-Pro aminopeptidase [Tenericutes bacterium ADurb.Bin087]|nr:MAG: Xaa-Pro aminopeptidase [Tenericutes bacterium ADurb.Bin087]
MNKYKIRRERLYKALTDNSALILFSGCEIKKSADAFYDFEVNRNFFYLTGIKQEGSILVVTKSKNKIKETILTSPYDAHKEIWTGRRLKPEEVTMISGITDYKTTAEWEVLQQMTLAKVKTIYLDLEPGIFTNTGMLVSRFSEQITNLAKVKVENVYPLIMRLRMVKDEAEIALIRESIALTKKALDFAISKVKPGAYEYEVAAAFEYKIKKVHGELGFSTIAATGANAVILHYPDLNSKLETGELLLLDLGGHNNNMYTADISRTVPVNGKFTPLQITIYEIVLACNKAVINFIKPGKTIADLQTFTREFLKERLVKAKLMTADEDISNYYYHGVSHHLGLDTHDPADRSLPLEKGNVITVEPGLYFAKYGIGVRIEDNVLVTDKGAENLSISIPKEIKEIVS